LESSMMCGDLINPDNVGGASRRAVVGASKGRVPI
jgi:hypothetical protein